MVWWDKPVEGSDLSSPHHSKPGAASVEMASYALLTYIERGNIDKAKPIVMWLTKARNSVGGFYSTQVPNTSRDSEPILEIKQNLLTH